jgi:VanZ family protein
MIRIIAWFKPYSKYFMVAWLIIIFTISSIPSLKPLFSEKSRSFIKPDHVIHFCEYGLLTFLAYLMYTDNHFRITLKKYLVITAGLILFALVDEFHQKFVPGRSFNMKDIYSNIAGIIAGFIFCVTTFRIMQRKQEEKV